jgi:ketosteroid isomerase-like protein
MGHLTLSSIEIHLLDDNVAVLTGAWRLERSRNAGPNIGGLFSLVFQHRAKEWKIALDHTS